nr:T9SS type A sorting domain-containing protein [uncultured Flavobacterium sp.]
MKKYLIIISILLLNTLFVNAQVLFSEDFDRYPVDHLNTDYTGTTIGQGGWLMNGTNATAMVTAEIGKGNVLIITSNNNSVNGNGHISFTQAQGVIDDLWNNRTAGNNVLKLELEFYGIDIFNGHSGIMNQGPTLINVGFQSNQNRIVANYYDTTNIKNIILKNYGTAPFPYNTWIKTEMFIDYNTKNVYFYIPTLNLQSTGSFSHNRIPENINFAMYLNSLSSVAKFDNIKITALQTIPSYILSTNEQLAEKFNMYPNPANNVVNITNNENRLVNKIEVYDTTGKLINMQNYNNEAEIQLNVENLASGTYMLHLQTTEGTTVKKLVKK